MKNLLLFASFTFMMSSVFGQFSVKYDGFLTNTSSTPIMLYIEIDSMIVDSTLSDMAGNYNDSVIGLSVSPFMIRILFYDCHGNLVSDFDISGIAPGVTTIPASFDTLAYCPPSPCAASFAKYQATGPGGVPVPNRIVLVDNSLGTNLSYSWDFGDGSAPLVGLNVTHTYATHGSYNVCLTITSNTATGTCTSVFCDTLTVDSLGIIRSSFTVTTGNSLTSVEEISTLTEVKLYPNPAQLQTILELNSLNTSELTIRIIDFKGAELQRIERGMVTGANRIELNTSNLEEGMYLIQLNDGINMTTKRLQIIK